MKIKNWRYFELKIRSDRLSFLPGKMDHENNSYNFKDNQKLEVF